MKSFRPAVIFLTLLLLLPVAAYIHTGYRWEPVIPALAPKAPLLPWPADRALRVLTRNAPTIYYEGPDGPTGLEYELVQLFADYLGAPLELTVLDNVVEILDALEQKQGDIAAAGLAYTADRAQRFAFSPGYQCIRQQVVCRRGGVIPKTPEALTKVDLAVVADTSYVEQLTRLQEDYPDLTWTTELDLSTENLMEWVWKRNVDCTIADSNIIDINRRYYPELVIAFDLGPQEPLRWVLSKENTLLMAHLDHWFKRIKIQGELKPILDKYYAHVEIFDYVDIAIYHRRIRERLPKWQALFEEAAEKYTIPWDILAALSYQESHWNSQAKSPTGVRGIMMLTRQTAKMLGVKDRLDAKQSIMGGARYLKRLLARVPETVEDDDERLKFALAAYNVGMAHMHDAQILARQLGKDSNRWHELQTVLPLLADETYYKKLKHGYARGWEPVRYVQRIWDYMDILRQQNDQQLTAKNEIPEKESKP